MSHIIDLVPTTYEEASRNQVWKDSMKEFDSIMKNDVWEVIPRFEGKSEVIFKWIFNSKHRAYGRVENNKPIFVARGFSQKEGIDYDETFSLVA